MTPDEASTPDADQSRAAPEVEPLPEPGASEIPAQRSPGGGTSGGGRAWVPPSPEALSRLLPQYQIGKILGRGGMGVVYKGLQVNLRRPVAIKLLPAELAEDPEFTARFQREAYTLASLRHPGIVDVYNSGQTGEGHLYFVMEFVDGTDLTHLIGKRGLELEQAMELVGQICDALHYAHLQGVIHRDIKPANVLLTKNGCAKIADFGLARPADMGGMTMLTATNLAVGTPDYMAPEQTMGMADQRSDIYSLGIMFYQMLTGRVPKGRFPMPSAFGQGDERLDAVVTKAIQQFPEHRYQDANEVKTAIEELRMTLVPTNVPPSDATPISSRRPHSGPSSGARTSQAPVQHPIQARTSHITRQVYRPPQSQAAVPFKKHGSLGWWVLLLIVIGVTAWFYWNRDGAMKDLRATVHAPPAAAAPTTAEAATLAPGNWEWLFPALMTYLTRRDADGTGYIGAAPLTAMRLKEQVLTVQAERGGSNYYSSMPCVEVEGSCEVAFRLQLPPAMGSFILGIPVKQRHAVVLFDTIKDFAGINNMATAKPCPLPADGRDHEVLVHLLIDEKLQQAEVVLDVDGRKALTWSGAIASIPPNDHTMFRKAGSIPFRMIFNNPGTVKLEALRARSLGNGKVNLRPIIAASTTVNPARSPSAIQTQAPIIRAPMSGGPAPAAAAPGSIPAPAPTPKSAFTNSLGMKFVPVPGTDVLFCIHETRRKDYAAFAAESGGLDASWKNSRMVDKNAPVKMGVPVGAGDDHPVVSVTWSDSRTFCEWLSKKENRTYRLPTNREWDCAVGAMAGNVGTTTPDEFPWGNQWPPPSGAGNLGDTATKERFPSFGSVEGYTDGFPTTAPVMNFKPSKLGLYDLAGNVFEWIEDSSSKSRVMRGGSWATHTRDSLASTNRSFEPSADYHNSTRGFRCVLEIRSVGSQGATTVKPVPAPPPPPLVPTQPSTSSKGAITNSLGMKFVPVPGTDVLMCIHETRQQDYAAFVAENPLTDGSWQRPDKNQPVENRSWEDASAFCVWLSRKEGRAYRLPSDREWSFAAGIGDREPAGETPQSLSGKISDVYPWGNEWPPPAGSGNFADVTAMSGPSSVETIPNYKDGYVTSSPVMSFTPNKLGIYDLAGNMLEWCADWADGSQRSRVMRSSAYNWARAEQLLSSKRNFNAPDRRSRNYGFRVVLVSSPETLRVDR